MEWGDKGDVKGGFIHSWTRISAGYDWERYMLRLAPTNLSAQARELDGMALPIALS